MNQQDPGTEMAGLKIGPTGSSSGSVWNLIGQIVQIRISYDTPTDSSFGTSMIRSLQFEYVKDGQLGISDIIGAKGFNGRVFQTVTFDYPSEYIIGVEGDCHSSWMQELSIETNRKTYGPFGSASGISRGASTPAFGQPIGPGPVGGQSNKFSYKFGPENQFGGFHGTHDSDGVKSIGVYLNPGTCSSLLAGPRLCSRCLREVPEAGPDLVDNDDTLDHSTSKITLTP